MTNNFGICSLREIQRNTGNSAGKKKTLKIKNLLKIMKCKIRKQPSTTRKTTIERNNTQKNKQLEAKDREK